MHSDDQTVLAEALEQADLRVLLMCLYQVTGDQAWLKAPFLPARDVRLVADPSAGLSPEAQERVRDAAREILTDPRPPAIPVPDEDLLNRMMSTCLGEDVPPEYAPMMHSEMGFASAVPEWTGRRPADRLPSVLIVGAGLSGIALGAQLGQLGIPYQIAEKNEGVGGTWWENVYPGAGVDTPNHAYSFSHGPRYQWSRFFALRDEIQDYIETCADEFDVRRHVRFRTRVTGARWDEASSTWNVRIQPDGASEETVVVDYLVTAIGVLNSPKVPVFTGQERFTGRALHSARWPADLDVDGRDIAVIGTGATAMQLVPALAGRVRSITVYQRSPQWVRPVDGYKDEMPKGMYLLMGRMPFYYEWFRFTMFWRYADGLLKTLRKDPSWPHPERAVNARNDLHRQELTDFIQAELAGRPELIDKCLPHYPPFGKRILIDNGWYRTIRRPDVELVTEGIDRFEGDDIVTRDGVRRRADVVIYATGFDVTQLAASLDVVGRDGISLRGAWRDENPTAYLGMGVHGFPNFFCLLGPNSALGHGGSTIFQSECQARYIAAAIVAAAERGVTSVEIRREVQDEYVASVDVEHEALIWTHPGMTNWYRNRYGRVIAIMPWRLVDFWHMTSEIDLDEYIVEVPENSWPREQIVRSTGADRS